MVPLLIGAILFPRPWLFQALCVLCITVALHEYFSLVWHQSSQRFRLFGTMLGLLCSIWWLFHKGFGELGLALPCLVILLGFLFFTTRASVEHAHHRLGHLLFGIFYVGGLGIHVALIRELPDGIFWVFALLAATWLNDTCAYFAGHAWGRHRLAPALSPGKTWEGWVGGLLGSLIGLLLFWLLLPNPLALEQVFLLAFLASLFGPAGDLSESLLKRSTGIKDSGHIIPGHGGMLDRIDALLFTGPLFYYFAIWAV